MGPWLRRLVYLFRQTQREAELREEIETHRALRAARLEREGLTPQAAAGASRRGMGNILLAREDAREAWLGPWGGWWQDVRYGLRTFRRDPTFTAVAVSTLALGIGVNAGIFTVLNGVLFRDLPAPEAHELVSISQAIEGLADAEMGPGTFSTSEYLTYRDRTRSLPGLLAHSNPMETTLGGEIPQQLFGVLVSCNYFEVLRQPPVLGRVLAAGDCTSGAPAVVVLGHALWRTAFAADRGILGRPIELNRQIVTVVGVASEGTYGGSALTPGYFAPLAADPLLGRTASRYEDDTQRWLFLIGRRSGTAGVEQVRADLAVIAAQIDRQQPGRSTALTIERATPMTVPPFLRRLATGAAAVLMAAFALVLLIACANGAHLLLARGTARSQEIAIRLSLGASRARVVRQLLTESLLIAFAGGLLGCVLALWSFEALAARVVPSLVPPEFPAVVLGLEFAPDVRVLAFAVLLTLATSILFGLAPALQVSRPDLLSAVKQDSTGAGHRSGRRLRGTLVGVQVALSMALMIAAGLLMRGLYATYSIDPGFAYRDIAYVSYGLDGLPYEGERAAILLRRLRDTVEALPGVDAVALASDPPLGEERAAPPIRLPGEGERQVRVAELNAVSPGYFSLVGIPILRGRTFTEAEFATAARGADPRPVVVSETTARNLWPGADPIGRTLLWDDDALHVVGVAADAHVNVLGTIDPYYMYVAGGEELLVKSRLDFGATASSIYAAVRALDPKLVVRVLPLEANLGWWRGVAGTVTTLGAALGVLALALAAVGIYGGVSYSVRRRYREIGIRIALGAGARSVLAMMLRQTMRPVVVGAAIGLGAGAALSRILSGLLFGVSPADPIGMGGAALLVLAVALAAGLMAARPASNADPAVTLRCD